MNTQAMLMEMASLCGPSGFEDAVSRRCAELLKAYTDDIRTDRLGNTIAHIPCGKPGAKKLMLDAHIDEISLVVCAVEDGWVRFEKNGIDPRMLPGHEVTLLCGEGPLFGVVSCLPPHVLTQEQMEKPIEVKDMYIDVGFSQEEAARRIPVGTLAVFRERPVPLAGGMLSGRAMDDRAGFVTLLCALEQLKGKHLDVDLYVLASAQEETGARAAGPIAFDINPDYAIIAEMTHGNTPDSKNQTHTPMGAGPALNWGPNTDRRFTKFIADAGAKAGVPVQHTVHTRQSGTNAFSIQITRSGVLTAIVEVPTRYMHSPVECVKIADVENAGKLIAAACENLKEGAF